MLPTPGGRLDAPEGLLDRGRDRLGALARLTPSELEDALLGVVEGLLHGLAVGARLEGRVDDLGRLADQPAQGGRIGHDVGMVDRRG
mgnify:CR=1 FL=1